ncbi:MAG: hypothetical protein GXN98_02565, partial [Euryarchaeota archaeon]|nr:hypothetical protein [Euryarchaeota archaeon]
LENMSDAEFEDFLSELKDYLTELKYENIPYGLHTFGIPPEGDALVTFVMNILGRDYTSATKQVNSSCLERCSFELLKAVLNGSDVNQTQIDFLGNVSANVTEQLELALSYADLLVNGTSREVDSLLDALEGRYIKPNVGGDPLRAPEALPTGRNFYSFDPRGIPTTAAWKVGKALPSSATMSGGTAPTPERLPTCSGQLKPCVTEALPRHRYSICWALSRSGRGAGSTMCSS